MTGFNYKPRPDALDLRLLGLDLLRQLLKLVNVVLLLYPKLLNLLDQVGLG